MPTRSVVVMADRFDDSPQGRMALALVHWASGWHAADRSPQVHAVLWERPPAPWTPPPGVRVREVEAINRWALPRELVRFAPTRPIGRRLRQARVRLWWHTVGDDPLVARVAARPELGHYVPPTGRVVEVAPDGQDLIPVLWRSTLRRSLGLPPGAALVGGAGEPSGRAGIDQFVAAAGDPALHDCHFVWFHGPDEDVPVEIRHDAAARGVRSRVHWWPALGSPPMGLTGCDAVVDAGRPARVDIRPSGVPVVRYGVPPVTASAARPEQLAAAVARAVTTRVAPTDDDEIVGALGWGDRR